MRLYEEYISRHGFRTNGAKHVRKGYVYFRGGLELLSIRWIEVGPHPGFYEFSECVLGTSCRVRKSHKVVWDESEIRLAELVRRAGSVVSEPSFVFSLTWEYFVRRHEELLSGSFSLSEIVATLNPLNPDRLLSSMDMLERLAQISPASSNFWHSRAFAVIDTYCYWAAEL